MAVINYWALVTITTCSLIAGDAYGAESGNIAGARAWRTELVECNDAVAIEAAAVTKLGELLLGRGIDMAFGALRKAITKAGSDDSKTFEMSNATYLIDLYNQNMDTTSKEPASRRRACVIIGNGVASDGGLAENDSILNGVSVSQQQVLKSNFRALRMDSPGFFAKVKFEQSNDAVAIKPVLTQLYYPRHLYKGRKGADRQLLIAIEIGEPGVADKMLYAGTLTLENISVSEKLIANSASLVTQSKVGWSLKPEINVKLDELVPDSKRVFPVNLTSTVTETAAGSKFFKKLDEYLDDATTKAIKDEIDSSILPGKINDGKLQRQQAYRDAIIDFYAKSGALSAACAELKAQPGSQTTISQAWAAFFSAESAYLKLQQARVSGVLQEELTVQKPKQCAL